MARLKTPTFILELPLKTTPYLEKKLLKRLDAARQVYNACLGESLKRLRLLRQSKAYRKACKMPKGSVTEKKARAVVFAIARQNVGLRKYDLAHWATQFTHTWLRDHVASQEVKVIAIRAFGATERYLYGTDRQCRKGRCTKKEKNCAVCCRPHFKRYDTLNSVENSTNLQGLRWREDGNYVQWRDLEIPAIVDEEDSVHVHGLSCRVKYTRICRKVLNGRDRFYVQLVLEGQPLQRLPVNDGGIVGLDIGPSTVAVVGEDDALLVQFCAELEDISREKRRLQRRLDRQRRANNPDCFDEKGRAIRGKHPRVKSGRMLRTEVQVAELQRKQAAYRKSLHGQLANQILAMGNIIKTEKLSYRSFQRIWGKSVGKRAPGMFVQMLRQKAKVSGGEVQEFSTYHTRLSQVCHNCGTVKKKPLGQRWHKCDCGIVAQRDLYSAFLASCVDAEINTLNADLACERWSAAGSLLQAAFRETQSANGKRNAPASFGLGQS